MRKTPSVDVVGALGATDGLSPARCRGIVFRCSPPGVRDSNHLAFAENLFSHEAADRQRFRRPLYAAAAPLCVGAAFDVALIAMAGGSARELRRANPCSAAVCRMPGSEKSRCLFRGARQGTFGGVSKPILIAGRDNFRDNHADNRHRVTCDVVYT